MTCRLDVQAAVQRNKLTVLGINTPPGDRAGEFGLAAVPGREKDFQVLFGRALDYIATIGGSAVHCLAGKVEVEQRPAAERVFVDNLRRAADLAGAKGINLLIEPINPRDRPNYYLHRVEHAADIIGKVGRPNVKTQFDFYHAQIVGGDLLHRLQQHLPMVGHLQCAAVPARHEPDEGEVNYRFVFAEVDRMAYPGWIGAEYRPRERTEAGLGWGRDWDLVPAVYA